MYSLEALRQKIGKEGVESVIKYLSSDNLPEEFKKQLTESHILVDGYINMSLIYKVA